MGLFSFIKNAGAKVFGIGKTDAEEAKEASAEKAAAREAAVKKAAGSIKETIRDLNLEAENLNVVIVGDKVTLSGKAKDQTTKEKIILVAGNVEGIAQVDDQMEVINKEPEAQFYTVEEGDTLGKIAKTHYGNAMKYPVIFEANKPMLKDPDKIYPGQVLRIPKVD